MESYKKFGLLKFDKKLTIFIKEIVSEEEIFADLKIIEDMKAFVDLSLSQLNVTKLSDNRYRSDIQILINTNQKELTTTLLESKGFVNIESKNTISKSELANNDGLNMETASRHRNQKIIYTEKYHFDKKSKISKDLYRAMKKRILDEYNDIEAVPFKMYIAFKLKGKSKGGLVLSAKPMRDGLKVVFNAEQGELNDYLNRTRDVSNIGHLGHGDYELKIINRIEIDYLMELFRESYELKLKK